MTLLATPARTNHITTEVPDTIAGKPWREPAAEPARARKPPTVPEAAATRIAAPVPATARAGSYMATIDPALTDAIEYCRWARRYGMRPHDVLAAIGAPDRPSPSWDYVVWEVARAAWELPRAPRR